MGAVDERYQRLMRDAVRTNRERDDVDRACGFAAPGDCPVDDQARTIMMAIQSGITNVDWSCVAEAQAMLIDFAAALGAPEAHLRRFRPTGGHTA